MSSQIRQTVPFVIKNSQLVLQDFMTHNFDDLTSHVDENLFKVERQPFEPFTSNKKAQVEIEISFSQDLDKVRRVYYNFLDAVSDIGGIMAVIGFCISMWLSIWNFKHMDNYIVSQLFRSPESTTAPICVNGSTAMGEPIIVKRYSNFLEYILSLLPATCLRCRKKNRNQRRLEKARALMNAEINLIEIVKSRRYFQEALKFLLPR